jgi:uncharacterized OB-fold protein
MAGNAKVEPFELPFTDWKPQYLYSLGELSPFFRAIVDEKRLLGSKCPKCSKVWMPPRGDCPDCYETTEWVELTGEGEVVSCTYCYFPGASTDLISFIGLPYVFAAIRLDGADTFLFHAVKPPSQKINEVKPGTRVKAVFREERRGTLGDFYFLPVSDA